MSSDTSMEAHSIEAMGEEREKNEPRGAESSGTFKGGNWRLYPAKEKNIVVGHVLHVWVKPNTWKKARLPKHPETSTPRGRASWCKDAAPAIFKAWHEAASKPKDEAPAPPAPAAVTFFSFARLWTSDELHEQYPDHVKRKKSSEADAAKFEWMKEVLGGDLPLQEFSLDHAERIMRELPRDLSRATRRHYAQAIHKLLAYAVYPARLLESHPLPRGFLPKIGPQKAKGHLYPDEEAALVGCAKRGEDGEPLVPLWRRIYWGFLAREGCRESEAIELQWRDVDLEKGKLTLDENKTDDPRAWALDPGVVLALKVWREIHPLRTDDGEDPPPDARVFVDDAGLPVSQNHLPSALRGDLVAAGVKRQELHQATKSRIRLRVHDLRGTFVTLALANGRTETWVMDRTGHRSSAMVNRYRRIARTAEEIGLGPLMPMNEAIPELRSEVPPPTGTGPGKGPFPESLPASEDAPLPESSAGVREPTARPEKSQ